MQSTVYLARRSILSFISSIMLSFGTLVPVPVPVPDRPPAGPFPFRVSWLARSSFFRNDATEKFLS